MAAATHESLITAQFGPRAAAYLASPVHARGEDLDQLAVLADGLPDARALDLGCGGGHVAFILAPRVARVVACDLSADMLDQVAREAVARGLDNLETRQGAAEALPFAAASFDLVVSRYSAHHWRAWEIALAEARRVLKPGGHAVFMDVASPGPALADTWLQAIELLRDPSHVRDRSAAEWTTALVQAGFAPSPPTARRLRLEFASWVARIGTPDSHVAAILALQAVAPREVRAHFALEDDGSLTVDTLSIEARAA